MSGSFDPFLGGTGTGNTDELCGNGRAGGKGALGVRGNGGAAAGGGGGTDDWDGFGGTVECGGWGSFGGCVDWGGFGVCKLEAVGDPVGPVFFGKTAVGAEDVVAIVAPKSGCGLLAGFSLGGSAGEVPGLAEVAAIVALGSKGLSAVTNKPPSTVQNF
jgi:hypothetical protein